MFEVTGPHLDEEAVITRHVMDLEHLGHASERPGDPVLPRLIGAANGDERQRPETKDPRVHERRVPSNGPSVFQLPDPFENSGRSEPYFPGHFNIRHPSIILKYLQNAYIYFVYSSEICH